MCALARTVARSRENRARIGGAWGIPHFLVTHFSTFAPLIAAKTNSFAIASVTWTPYTRLVSLLICSAHDSLSSTHSSRSLMRLPSRASLVRNIVGCELLTSSSKQNLPAMRSHSALLQNCKLTSSALRLPKGLLRT